MKIRVQEFFTHKEGVSTPCARHEGQQPLIEFAKNVTSILFILTFFMRTEED